MQFGVSLSGMGQQPVGTDMRKSFQEIVEYIRTARELGWVSTFSIRGSTT